MTVSIGVLLARLAIYFLNVSCNAYARDLAYASRRLAAAWEGEVFCFIAGIPWDKVLIVGSGASGVHFALSVLRKGYDERHA